MLRIGRLKEHVATPAEVQRLLAAIERNLADAQVTNNPELMKKPT
jgi:hypothetical protein